MYFNFMYFTLLRNFVEHIVHKTDAKVNAIREQLEKHLERKV